MSTYYISACHDCKQRVMWTKCTKEAARLWHSKFHVLCRTELGIDLEDDFEDSVIEYESLGISDGSKARLL